MLFIGAIILTAVAFFNGYVISSLLVGLFLFATWRSAVNG